jgi:hypothetical protein
MNVKEDISLNGMGREGTVPQAAVCPGSIVIKIWVKYGVSKCRWCNPYSVSC